MDEQTDGGTDGWMVGWMNEYNMLTRSCNQLVTNISIIV